MSRMSQSVPAVVKIPTLLYLLAVALVSAEAQTAPITHEVLVGCISKDGNAAQLTQENLTSNIPKITSVRALGDVPLDYVLVYDTSKSMERSVGKRAMFLADALFRTTVVSNRDRGSLVAFDTAPLIARGFTTSPNAIVDSLKGLRNGGGTALYDSLIDATKKFDEMGAGRPRFVFLISDGEDNQSHASRAEAIKALLVSHAHLIVIFPASAEKRRLEFLSKLAEDTGGIAVEAAPSDSTEKTLEKNKKEFKALSQLFHNWHRVEFDLPANTRLTQLKLKTSAECKLIYPRELVVEAKK